MKMANRTNIKCARKTGDNVARSCLTLMALVLCLNVAGSALAADAPHKPAKPITPKWGPQVATIIAPDVNVDKSHWKEYRSITPPPSVDQHLTDPILIGAIDLHAHFGPDAYGRQWDAFEIARLASQRGMRAIVLKNHWSESAGLAYLIRKYAGAPGLEVFGGLALNAPEGGINPQAVRYFAEVEGHYAKIVWFPTHDSKHEVEFTKKVRPYVRVSENGVLLKPVLEVLDLIKKYNLTLATGHVTPLEAIAILREAKKRGIEHTIVTHPGLGPMFTDPTIDQLKQMVALGAHVEIVANELWQSRAPKVIEMIRVLGPENCFVSTDSGLVGTPNHPDALVKAIQVLRRVGFSESDLDLMFRKNPAWLIGLPPV